MFVFGEGRFNDRIALIGPAHAFASDEFIESFLNRAIHRKNLSFRTHYGKSKSKTRSVQPIDLLIERAEIIEPADEKQATGEQPDQSGADLAHVEPMNPEDSEKR